MKTEDVIDQELRARLARMEQGLRDAKKCLEKRDYLQCAVELQEAAKEGTFETLLMNVFDSVTSDSANERLPKLVPKLDES